MTQEVHEASSNPEPAGLAELAELAKLVQTFRCQIAENELQIRLLAARLEQTPEFKSLQDQQKFTGELKATLQPYEERLRELAVKAYQATGDKHPWPTVAIRVAKRVSYDKQEAIQWCQANAPVFVVTSLSREFDKVAGSLPGAPVTVVEEPSAVISQAQPVVRDAEAEAKAEAEAEAKALPRQSSFEEWMQALG